MPECYVTKRGYQFEYDKPLYRGWGGGQNDHFVRYVLLNDPCRLCH